MHQVTRCVCFLPGLNPLSSSPSLISPSNSNSSASLTRESLAPLIACPFKPPFALPLALIASASTFKAVGLELRGQA